MKYQVLIGHPVQMYCKYSNQCIIANTSLQSLHASASQHSTWFPFQIMVHMTNLRINSAVQKTNFAQITSLKMLGDKGLKAKWNADAL